jgi:hypothetical protein
MCLGEDTVRRHVRLVFQVAVGGGGFPGKIPSSGGWSGQPYLKEEFLKRKKESMLKPKAG